MAETVVGKIFVRIEVETITRHLENNVPITDQQFGFRSGRSSSDFLLFLSRDWQNSWTSTWITLSLLTSRVLLTGYGTRTC